MRRNFAEAIDTLFCGKTSHWIDWNRDGNGTREEIPHQQGADQKDREMRKDGDRGARQAPQILIGIIVETALFFIVGCGLVPIGIAAICLPRLGAVAGAGGLAAMIVHEGKARDALES